MPDLCNLFLQVSGVCVCAYLSVSVFVHTHPHEQIHLMVIVVSLGLLKPVINFYIGKLCFRLKYGYSNSATDFVNDLSIGYFRH